MSTLTVSRHFVEASLAGARRLGLDTGELLHQAGISPDLLRIEKARVSSDQFSRLLQSIWTLSGDEFMGMGPRRARTGTFATMCALVINCETLKERSEERRVGKEGVSGGARDLNRKGAMKE